MGSCAAPSAKGDDKFITTDYLQQCPSGRQARLRQAAAGAPASLRRTRWRGFGLPLRSDA
ncbi:hypothetical protein E1I61_18935 [Salmonella enterica subsp. enterica serovar Infantis]|nr:hypothetical protein [Salmonella enterica subsp. enterica serovar Infantis]